MVCRYREFTQSFCMRLLFRPANKVCPCLSATGTPTLTGLTVLWFGHQWRIRLAEFSPLVQTWQARAKSHPLWNSCSEPKPQRPSELEPDRAKNRCQRRVQLEGGGFALPIPAASEARCPARQQAAWPSPVEQACLSRLPLEAGRSLTQHLHDER